MNVERKKRELRTVGEIEQDLLKMAEHVYRQGKRFMNITGLTHEQIDARYKKDKALAKGRAENQLVQMMLEML